MTWIHFLWGGLLGSISAIVAIILCFIFLKNFKTRLIGSLSLCVVIFCCLFFLLQDSEIESRFYEVGIPYYRVKNKMNGRMLALTHVPTLRTKLSTLNEEEQKKLLQELTGAGIKRLEAKDLIEWNQIRKRLADEDEEFCSGLYTGKLSEDTLWRAFSKLSNAELDQWTTIMVESGRREWEKTDFEKPNLKSLQTGLEVIAKGLPKKDSERLGTILALGTSNSEESACWAMRKILIGTTGLKPELQVEFLRSLAIQF